MAAAGCKRRKIFVNRQVQGAVLWRFAGYWFLYHFILLHTLFLFYFLQHRLDVLNGQPPLPFGQLYLSFYQSSYPIVLAAVAILPMLLLDCIRTTHRIAGPLVRFQNTLRQLRNGEHVEAVQLRHGDLLVEFQNEFNAFLKDYNARLASQQAPRDPQSHEERLLKDAEQLRAEVNTPQQHDEIPAAAAASGSCQ